MAYCEWTKRLGQRHYYDTNNASVTLCGKPMLGNNYSAHIQDSEKQDCPECEKVIDELNDFDNQPSVIKDEMLSLIAEVAERVDQAEKNAHDTLNDLRIAKYRLHRLQYILGKT